MKRFIKLIALALITLIVALLIVVVSTAQAGGPWNDQYCDVEVTKIKVVNEQGEVIEEPHRREVGVQ
jgi:hypothetical protein